MVSGCHGGYDDATWSARWRCIFQTKDIYKLSEIKNLVQKNVSEIRQYIGLSVAVYSPGGARAYVEEGMQLP